jgi:hypothetical protein
MLAKQVTKSANTGKVKPVKPVKSVEVKPVEVKPVEVKPVVENTAEVPVTAVEVSVTSVEVTPVDQVPTTEVPVVEVPVVEGISLVDEVVTSDTVIDSMEDEKAGENQVTLGDILGATHLGETSEVPATQESNSGITLSEDTQSKPEPEKKVRIQLLRSHKCCIGMVWYNLEKDKYYNVPENVKQVLLREGLLKPQ